MWMPRWRLRSVESRNDAVALARIAEHVRGTSRAVRGAVCGAGPTGNGKETARSGALAALVRTVGQTLELSLRPSDSVGRWQENEFLAILQECTGEEARETGMRLRKMAAMAKIEWWGDVLPITLSIGASEVRTGDSSESVLRRAEASLQECRSRGGDRVLIDEE